MLSKIALLIQCEWWQRDWNGQTAVSISNRPIIMGITVAGNKQWWFEGISNNLKGIFRDNFRVLNVKDTCMSHKTNLLHFILENKLNVSFSVFSHLNLHNYVKEKGKNSWSKSIHTHVSMWMRKNSGKKLHEGH